MHSTFHATLILIVYFNGISIRLLVNAFKDTLWVFLVITKETFLVFTMLSLKLIQWEDTVVACLIWSCNEILILVIHSLVASVKPVSVARILTRLLAFMPDELGLSLDPVSFLIAQLILQAVRALLELNHSLCK